MGGGLNRRELNRARREMLHSLGDDLRRQREDAGRSQSAIAGAAGIAQSYLSRIEAGAAEPSLTALLSIAAALGADVGVRVFPNSGPRIRDHVQAMIGETLLATVHPRWIPSLEVRVYRPIRGIIDVVLSQADGAELVATEIQGQLHRVEQQLRWAGQKADALAALPEHAGRHVSRLLVVRNTAAMRELVRSMPNVFTAAFPAAAAAAHASLTATEPWPGPALLWADVAHGRARMLDGPPRGIPVGRGTRPIPKERRA